MKSLRKFAVDKRINSISSVTSCYSLLRDHFKFVRIYNSIASMPGLRMPEKLMLSAISIDQKDWSALYRKANVIFNIRKGITYIPPINMFRRSQ